MLLFSDSFDSYDSDADLARRYHSTAGSGLVNTTGGRYSGGCLVIDSTSDSVLRNWAATGDTNTRKICMSFAFWSNDTPSASARWLRFQNRADSTSYVPIMMTSGGLLAINDFAPGAGTSLYGTGSTNVCDGAWHHIEIYYEVVSATVGEFRLYLDGVLECTYTGDNILTATGNYSFQQFVFYTDNASHSYRIDDIIVYDEQTGYPDYDTDFPIGDTRLLRVLPNGAGSNTGFTPSAGANYAAVDDDPADGDTTYVESSTTGHKDSHAFAALGVSPSTIKGVVAVPTARNSGNAGVTLKGYALSSASGGNGDNGAVTLPQSYKSAHFMFELDPNGSVAWTESAINAAEFGYEVG